MTLAFKSFALGEVLNPEVLRYKLDAMARELSAQVGPDGDFVLKGGDTMTGPLTAPGFTLSAGALTFADATTLASAPYTKPEADGRFQPLGSYAPSVHTHDIRYVRKDVADTVSGVLTHQAAPVFQAGVVLGKADGTAAAISFRTAPEHVGGAGASISRAAGVNGPLDITNTGTGDVALQGPAGTNVFLRSGTNGWLFGASGLATFPGALTLNAPQGTAPLGVVSTTMVSNLNADMVDGLHASAFQLANQKGVASGYASLDASGRVPTAQLPAIALTNVFPVASQAAQLALVCEPGDVAVRTDISTSYMLKAGGNPSVLADWQELLTPPAPVTAVNGMVGNVTISTITGNAGSATKLATARAIGVSGAVTGSGSFDGTANLTITTALALATNPGLDTSAGLRVKEDTARGMGRDVNGLYVNTADKAGLMYNAGALAVNLHAGGGLAYDGTSGGLKVSAAYQPLDADLTAIAALAGTSGLLRKTAADTWTLDTNTYVTAASAGNTYVLLNGDSAITGNISITGKLDVNASGARQAKFGTLQPLTINSTWPSIGFNLENDAGTWKYASGPFGGSYIQAHMANSAIEFFIGNVGNAGATFSQAATYSMGPVGFSINGGTPIKASHAGSFSVSFGSVASKGTAVTSVSLPGVLIGDVVEVSFVSSDALVVGHVTGSDTVRLLCINGNASTLTITGTACVRTFRH